MGLLYLNKAEEGMTEGLTIDIGECGSFISSLCGDSSVNTRTYSGVLFVGITPLTTAFFALFFISCVAALGPGPFGISSSSFD